jgi:NADPH:quinone reductase-like Zn-dependent oxidoreductase
VKAAVYTSYGAPDVVSIVDLPDPQPRLNEVVVRVVATTVCAADVRIRALAMPKGFGHLARPVFGWTRPRKPILGMEFAGIVEECGRDIKAFSPGERAIWKESRLTKAGSLP